MQYGKPSGKVGLKTKRKVEEMESVFGSDRESEGEGEGGGTEEGESEEEEEEEGETEGEEEYVKAKLMEEEV